MEGISVEKIIKYAEDSLEAAENALDKADNVGIVNAYGNYMFARGEFMMAMNILRNVSMHSFSDEYNRTIKKNMKVMMKADKIYDKLKTTLKSTNADRAVE